MPLTNPGLLIEQGFTHFHAGRLKEAERLFRRVQSADPLDADGQHLVGLALWQQEKKASALPYFERAVKLNPRPWQYQQNLGLAYQAAGRLEDARTAFTAAAERNPLDRECWHNLGTIELERDNLDDAEAHLKRAINLGQIARGRATPDILPGIMKGLALDHFNLGCLHLTAGEVPEAARQVQRALYYAPDFSEAFANLIYCRDFLPETTAGTALVERKAFGTRFAAPLKATWRPHTNDRDPERRLRVGYLGGDFKDHTAAFSFAPILTEHDPDVVDIVIYSNQGERDEDRDTRMMQKAISTWRTISGWTDEAVADAIRADEVDILVDLSGYTNRHRLLTLARKPAPVQVTAWGYLTGTGLGEAVGAIFADDVVAPLDHQRFYTERIVHLPHALGYAIPAFDVPIVPLPKDEPLTFGYLGRVAKISSATVSLWAEILRDLPESRLLLKDEGFEYPRVRTRIAAAFEAEGVDPSRLEMLGRTKRPEHMATYNRVHVTFDPIPQGGGATSLESLWMGTPVVTMLGDRIPGRMTASHLVRLGGDLDAIPQTRDQYVGWAVWLGNNIQSMDLSCYRPHLAASVICRADVQARAVESAYRDLWREWVTA